jgi:hypothetical protein
MHPMQAEGQQLLHAYHGRDPGASSVNWEKTMLTWLMNTPPYLVRRNDAVQISRKVRQGRRGQGTVDGSRARILHHSVTGFGEPGIHFLRGLCGFCVRNIAFRGRGIALRYTFGLQGADAQIGGNFKRAPL